MGRMSSQGGRGGGRSGRRGGGRSRGRGGGRSGGCGFGRAPQQPQPQPQPEPEPEPEPHEQAGDEHMEEEVQEEQPLQLGQRELDPHGLWFDDHTVSRAITSAMQSYFHYPWQNYSQVDQATKDHWWNLFKPNFRWRAELDRDVRQGYEHKAGVRLKDLHNFVTKKKRGVCPSWLPSGVHEQMMKNAQDKDFIARSQKAQRNRRGGNLANSVPPSHCQGSISTSQRAKRLAAKSGGVLPTAADLYSDTHFREEPGKGKVPVSDKAKKVKETYDKNVAECQASDIQKNLNQIFFDTVGGRKKGKVPGLGTGADLYYQRSSRRTCTSSSAGCTPSIVSQLSQRLEESERVEQEMAAIQRERLELERERLEMERERMQWQQAREKERRREREYIEEMKRSMESYISQCGGSFPFTHPRDPPDSSRSGGSCAT